MKCIEARARTQTHAQYVNNTEKYFDDTVGSLPRLRVFVPAWNFILFFLLIIITLCYVCVTILCDIKVNKEAVRRGVSMWKLLTLRVHVRSERCHEGDVSLKLRVGVQ